MDWPADGTMLLLMAIRSDEPVEVAGAEVILPGLGVPVNMAAFGELESRGWIVVEEAGPVATERGRYWFDRWIREVVVGRTRGPGRLPR